MSEFTFLTWDQIFGDAQLDILRNYGKKCAISDFSILLGGNSKMNWWTKDAYMGKVSIVNTYGKNYINYAFDRSCGSRPAAPYSSISKFISNKRIGIEGILEVEYGEYPQDIVSEELSRILENEFKLGNLKKTGKSYTTDSVSCQDLNTPFQARTHIEYEYNGKKYIRFIADSNSEGQVLSNGNVVKIIGDVCWIEVLPIKWLVDEKANIALSKKILFSGIQFSKSIEYDGDFYKTDIKEFMDKYFSKEIIPNVTREMTDEKNIKELSEEEQKKRNPYGLDFDKVSEEDIIKGAIESGVAVFLHGKSSDGKSARIKQIDPDCEIIYLRNATPESLNGKSVYNSETGEMIDVKPTWLKKLEARCEKEPDKYHIVFLDEITNALPSIQGIAFNIVLDKEVNGIWKLPENARIVAAGNEMKDSLAANQLAEPLFNRFAHVYIETTVESWLKWASENNIHPAIYAYIAYKKDSVLRTDYNGETPNADPRKWEMASKMLYSTKNPEMLRALVGEDITREFVSFCNQRIITLEDVLTGNYSDSDLEMNTSEKYATAIGLSQVDMENFEVVREFVLQLGEEICATFESLWAHGEEERLEKIAELRMLDTTKTR